MTQRPKKTSLRRYFMLRPILSKIQVLLVVPLVFALGCAVEENDDFGLGDNPFGTGAQNRPIQEIIAQTFVLQDMEALLVTSKVAGDMKSPPYTVFAPWDYDIERLPYWTKITRNRAWYGHMRDLTLGLIHEGNLSPESIQGTTTVTMMNGDTVTVTMENGRVRVDGIRVIGDTAASDGYLYMLQGVPEPRWTKRTVMDIINSDERFSILAQILNHPSMSAKRQELASATAELTFFAPTNSALAGFDIARCTDAECLAKLDLLVKRHLVGALTPKLFTSTKQLTTQAGSKLDWNFDTKSIDCTNDDNSRQETALEIDEEYAMNGLVHPVDKLLCIKVDGNRAVIPKRYSGNLMQGYLFDARNNTDWAHLGDDKIKFPVLITSNLTEREKAEFGEVLESDKERLKDLMQSIINEFVGYLYVRYGFNVRHVTLFEIGRNELDGRYYNGVIPLHIDIAPNLSFAGLSTGGNHYVFKMKYVANADYTSGFSTSEVVRHEFGHGWGLRHELMLPSCVYGAPGFNGSRLRLYGNDINMYTHYWRKISDARYKRSCPEGYRTPQVGELGPYGRPLHPNMLDGGTCLPDVQNMYRMKIRNKGTGKCLSYSSSSSGVIVDQINCDIGSLNQQWDFVQSDEYGRLYISPRQSNFTLSIHSEDLSNNQGAKMELGFDEEYSPWYMIPNEDGTWMLQQTETVQVMGVGGFVEQRLPIGHSKERWYIEPVQENSPNPDMPRIKISQSSLLFENIGVNDSESQNVVIRNDGKTVLEIMRIDISGNNPTDFSIGNNTCSNQSMAPGVSCSLSITFSPASVRLKNAALLIRSNDPLNSRLIVVLAGNAVNAGFPQIQYPWNDNRHGTTRGNLYLNGGHRELGWRFTPKVDGHITKLGGAFNGENVVKLINLDKSKTTSVSFELDILATVSVKNNTCNRFNYADIEPVAVKAGTNYAIYITQADNFKYCRTEGIVLPQDLGGDYGITIKSSFDDYSSNDFASNELYVRLPDLDICFVPD
jgi:uncharacterized surface protein with fasciclin (FAS1) repeats